MKCKHCGEEMEGYVPPKEAIRDRRTQAGEYVLMHVRDNDNDGCIPESWVGFYQEDRDGGLEWFWESVDCNDLVVTGDRIAFEDSEMFN